METRKYELSKYLAYLNTVEQACIEQKDGERLSTVLDDRTLILTAMFTGHDMMEIEIVNDTHGKPTFFKSADREVKRPKLSLVRDVQ